MFNVTLYKKTIQKIFLNKNFAVDTQLGEKN